MDNFYTATVYVKGAEVRCCAVWCALFLVFCDFVFVVRSFLFLTSLSCFGFIFSLFYFTPFRFVFFSPNIFLFPLTRWFLFAIFHRATFFFSFFVTRIV